MTTALEQAAQEAETLPAIDRSETAVVSSDRAENALCGALLHVAGAVDETRGLVRPEELHAPARAEIVRVAFAIAEGGGAVDETTVGAELARRRLLDRFGGDKWLRSFRAHVPKIDVVRTLATRVAELAQARRLIETCRRVVADGLNSVEDPKLFVERSLVRVTKVAESRTEGRVELMAHTVAKQKARWERYRLEGHTTGGLPTGFDGLDEITRGMALKQTSFVGALTGRGKSVYAMQVSTHNAGSVFNGDVIGVTYVSGEMDEAALHNRGVCALAGVSERMLDRVMCDSPDRPNEHPLDLFEREEIRKRIAAAQDQLERMPFAMFARAASISDIRAAVRESKRLFREIPPQPHWPAGVVPRVGLIVVDYVQMMKVERHAERHELALADFAYGVKSICDDENAHGLLCAQMNKNVKDKAHGASAEDMKGATALAESAGSTVYVDRPAYDMPKNSERRKILWPYSAFRVTKGRNHGHGEVAMIFEGQFYRFRPPQGEEVEAMFERARASGGKAYAPGTEPRQQRWVD